MSSLKRLFDTNGYVVVPRVWSTDEVDILMQAIQRIDLAPLKPGQAYYESDGRLKSLHTFPGGVHLALLQRAIARTAAVVSEALGAEGSWVGSSYFPKYAGTDSAVPPHQDNAFDCLDPAEGLVATLAIDWSIPENGPIEFYPGTHLLGDLPHRPTGVEGFSQQLENPGALMIVPRQVCIQTGDLCLHHCLTVHKSQSNRSAHNRRQFGMVWRTAAAKVDPVRWEAYQKVLADLHSRLTPSTSVPESSAQEE